MSQMKQGAKPNRDMSQNREENFLDRLFNSIEGFQPSVIAEDLSAENRQSRQQSRVMRQEQQEQIIRTVANPFVLSQAMSAMPGLSEQFGSLSADIPDCTGASSMENIAGYSMSL